MEVLFAVSECAPFVKTGGLADVAGALPKALARQGVRARVLMPLYPALTSLRAKPVCDVAGGRLLSAQAEGLDLLLFDAPALFQRDGGPYLDPTGHDWRDNDARFSALARAAAVVARGETAAMAADVLHAHDWQTGLAPLYVGRDGPPIVLTVQNIAFQGLFPESALERLGLPEDGFHTEGFEYWGQISMLKAGLVSADRITTVSPTYARELTQPAFGMGMEGVISARRGHLSGVLNGVDLDVWDPATDAHLTATYDATTPEARVANRTELARRFALEPNDDAPIFGVVSRLTTQKGLDLLLEALPRLLGRGARLAVIGTGVDWLENGFRDAQRAHPGQVGVVIGYSEPLAHLMQGGCDCLMVPSRFEPCGLTQLYALRYGALPLVARTGGLADTVIDANPAAISAGCATGFVCAPDDGPALADAIDRACDAYADAALWRGLQANAMAAEVGWDASAKAYAEIYAAINR